MATTYKLISSVTVGAGGAANIEFTSIPQTYTDLSIKLLTRSTTASVALNLQIQFNGSTSGYSNKFLAGYSGTAASSYNGQTNLTIVGYIDGANNTANTFTSTDIYIPNYTGSTYKSFGADSVMEDNSANNYAMLFAAMWQNTAAISSISFTTSNNFAQYSTAYLYGIKNS